MKSRSCSLSTACLVSMALALLGYVFGCAPRAYRTETYTDDDGTIVTRMIGKEIGLSRPGTYRSLAWRMPGKLGADAMCGLDAQRCQDVNGGVTYYLLLTIRWLGGGTTESYLDMSTAVSLSLGIGGRVVLLRPEKDQGSHRVTDTWSYPVSAGVLRELADAHEIEVTLSNEGGTLVGWCDNRRFKRFLEECGKPAEQSATPKQ